MRAEMVSSGGTQIRAAGHSQLIREATFTLGPVRGWALVRGRRCLALSRFSVASLVLGPSLGGFPLELGLLAGTRGNFGGASVRVALAWPPRFLGRDGR